MSDFDNSGTVEKPWSAAIQWCHSCKSMTSFLAPAGASKKMVQKRCSAIHENPTLAQITYIPWIDHGESESGLKKCIRAKGKTLSGQKEISLQNFPKMLGPKTMFFLPWDPNSTQITFMPWIGHGESDPGSKNVSGQRVKSYPPSKNIYPTKKFPKILSYYNISPKTSMGNPNPRSKNVSGQRVKSYPSKEKRYPTLKFYLTILKFMTDFHRSVLHNTIS